MKILRVRFSISVLVAALWVAQFATATTAQAVDEYQSKGWQVDFGIGNARDQNAIASDRTVGSTNYVKRIYLGYRFFDTIGIEAGLVGFDELNYKQDGTAPAVKNTYDFSGYHAKLYAGLPIMRDRDGFLAVFLSGGGWRWESEVNTPTTVFKKTGFSPTASTGLLFGGKSAALKLEYERFFVKPAVAPGDFKDAGNEIKLHYDVISVNFILYL